MQRVNDVVYRPRVTSAGSHRIDDPRRRRRGTVEEEKPAAAATSAECHTQHGYRGVIRIGPNHTVVHCTESRSATVRIRGPSADSGLRQRLQQPFTTDSFTLVLNSFIF